MKAKTKFEKRIVEIKDSLPQLSKKIKKWTYENFISPVGFTSNGDVCYCGHCGKSFQIKEVIGADMQEMKNRKKDPCGNCPKSQCKAYYDYEYKKLLYNPERCNSYTGVKEFLFDTYCPHCKRRLVVSFSNRRKIKKSQTVSAMINYKGIQLLRHASMIFEFTKGKPYTCKSKDKCVIWIGENGSIRSTRIKAHTNDHDGKGRALPSLTNDYASRFTRYTLGSYCINLYPEFDLAPYLKIRGLDLLSVNKLELYNKLKDGIFHNDANMIVFIKYLLKYPFVETLMKQGDFETLHTFFSYSSKEFETVLPSYLIMKRRRYVPADLKLWIDMVLLYEKLGKDIRNPKFICPDDLTKGHEEAQKLYERRREKAEQKLQKEFENARPRDIFWFLDHHPDEELKCVGNDEYLYALAENYGGLEKGWHIVIEDFCDETTGEVIPIFRRINDNGLPQPYTLWDYVMSLNNLKVYENYAKYEEKFIKLKGRFFNIEFSDDDMLIKSLNSLEEYKEEGIKMHNCVESNEYWRKPGTLVLSVRKGGERVADVELGLKSYKIIQCWGPCNRPTPYRDKIEKLIGENLHLIKERMDK